MPLPSSGPLSITAIRSELRATTYSLRGLASLAGFNTPDAMSEFYGYFACMNIGGGLRGPESTNAFAKLPNGQIVGVFSEHTSGALGQRIWKINADGTYVTSWSGQGMYCVTSDDNGGFWAGGSGGVGTKIRIGKFLSDNTEDPGFGTNNVVGAYVNTIVKQSGVNRIVCAATNGTWNGTPVSGVFRLDASTGGLDGSFYNDSTTDEQTQTVVEMADGSFLVGGYFTTYQGYNRHGLVKVFSNGYIDTSYNSGDLLGGSSRAVEKIIKTPDGGYLVRGFFTSYQGYSRNQLMKLDSSGNVLPGWNANLTTGLFAAQVLNSGKIIIGGSVTAVNGTSIPGFGCLNSDGSLFTGFNPGTAFGGTNYDCVTAVIDTGNGILVGSGNTIYNGRSIPYLVNVSYTGAYNSC